MKGDLEDVTGLQVRTNAELLELKEEHHKLKEQHEAQRKTQEEVVHKLSLALLKIKHLEKVKMAVDVECGRTITYNELQWPKKQQSPTASELVREREMRFEAAEVLFIDPLYTPVQPTNVAADGDPVSNGSLSASGNHPLNVSIQSSSRQESLQAVDPLGQVDPSARESGSTPPAATGSAVPPSEQSATKQRDPKDKYKAKGAGTKSLSPDKKKKQSPTKAKTKPSSIFAALLQSGKEQFPYAMRFREAGVQCNLMTRAKIINAYQEETKEAINDQIQEQIDRTRFLATKAVKAEYEEKLRVSSQEFTRQLNQLQ